MWSRPICRISKPSQPDGWTRGREVPSVCPQRKGGTPESVADKPEFHRNAVGLGLHLEVTSPELAASTME